MTWINKVPQYPSWRSDDELIAKPAQRATDPEEKGKSIMLRSTFILLTAMFAALLTNEGRAEHEGKVQILLVGDSTTEGIIPRHSKPAGPHLETVIEQLLALEQDLPPTHVINTGQSGDTVHRFLTSGRYDNVASKLPGLDYVFIRYGINDFTRRENFPENFPADFRELIGRIRKDHPHAVIVPMLIIPYLNDADSEKVNSLIRQASEEEKLPVFDIFTPYNKVLKEQGFNTLNYRRYPVEQVPEHLMPIAKPYIMGGRVVAMDNELDAIFGHLPGWYGDRHPNLAGYNVIAVETAKFLKEDLRRRRDQQHPKQP